MREIRGTSFNIDGDIVGRITLNKGRIFGRFDNIFVGKDVSEPVRGYRATITENASIKNTSIPYCVVSSIENFREGDVVLLNAQGEIVFIYEVASKHNAVMATELCNHRCLMCAQPPVLREKDKTPFNLKLISLFDKSTLEVGITGGEPTLIGDNLFLLIKHIKKELPKAAISILSNGVRFSDKEYTIKLAECRHKDLQIDIPLFSDIAKEHNRIVGAFTFYDTVKGLYNLALFRQRVGIRIVIHKQTYKRLPQLANFIYQNFPFVNQVAFMQMEPIGLAKDNFDELWIDPYDYNPELREAILLLSDRGIRAYIYNAQLCVLPEDIRPYAKQSISDWKDIYLPECVDCLLKGQCAGFFESSKEVHSRHIAKIEDVQTGASSCHTAYCSTY